MSDTATLLATWTPFLLTGFLWNIAVTVLAVTIGTSIGMVLAYLRAKEKGVVAKLCDVLSRFCRNVPTLAFLFFAAMAIPREFSFFGTVMSMPLWLKAAFGLSASVIGFTAESALVAYQNVVRRNYAAAMLLIPTWGTSVMISFIASSTASLVGVNELISRSNALIAATGTEALMPVYTYCACFFVIGCLIWMAFVSQMKKSHFMRSLPARIDSRFSLSARYFPSL